MLIAVLVVMAAVLAWSRIGPDRSHLVTGPLAAAVLVVLGVTAGLSRSELGFGAGDPVWALAGAGMIVAGYGVVWLVPAIRRRAFPGTSPERLGAGHAAYTALIAIPLATVIFEEVAFRGVLWGLVAREHGPAWAALVTSVLFGLWHVRPRRDRLLVVVGTVLFTMAAGLVFAVLRHHGGNLLAPVVVHWAANGLGVLLKYLYERSVVL